MTMCAQRDVPIQGPGEKKMTTIRKKRHIHTILEMAVLFLLGTQIRKGFSPIVQGSLKQFQFQSLKGRMHFDLKTGHREGSRVSELR